MKTTHKEIISNHKIFITLIFILSCIFINGSSQSLNTKEDDNYVTHRYSSRKYKNWKIARQSKGITLKYRKLTIADTIKTRELQANFYINSNTQKIINNIKYPSKTKQWNIGIRNHKLLKNNDTTWIAYTEQNIPFPFPQQDLVTKNKLTKRENTIEILINAVPNYIELKDGISRQKFFSAKWTLKQQSSGKIMATFSAISFDKSSIPRWIKDPIIQKTLIKSFSRLREISENQ